MEEQALSEVLPAIPSHLKVGDAVRVKRLFGNDVVGVIKSVHDGEVVVLTHGGRIVPCKTWEVVKVG